MRLLLDGTIIKKIRVSYLLGLGLIFKLLAFSGISCSSGDNEFKCDSLFENPYKKGNSWTYNIYHSDLQNDDTVNFGKLILKIPKNNENIFGQLKSVYILIKNDGKDTTIHNDRLASDGNRIFLKPPRFDTLSFTQVAPFPDYSAITPCILIDTTAIASGTLILPLAAPYFGKKVKFKQYYLGAEYNSHYRRMQYNLMDNSYSKFGEYELRYAYVPNVGFIYFYYTLSDKSVFLLSLAEYDRNKS